MHRQKLKIATVVVIVTITIAALILIVTGVVLLPNASDRTITRFAGVAVVVVLFSVVACVVLCLVRKMLRIINDQEAERERGIMISEEDDEAGECPYEIGDGIFA